MAEDSSSAAKRALIFPVSEPRMILTLSSVFPAPGAAVSRFLAGIFLFYEPFSRQKAMKIKNIKIQ